MKRLIIAGSGVIVATALAVALASGLTGTAGTYGLTTAPATVTATSGSMRSLLARETAVLTHKGLTQARADRTIDVQSAIAQASLVSRIEAAMGRAFAGIWFDPATSLLHVGVTSPASRRTVKAVVARTGLAAAVAETPVRFSWSELEAAQEHWIPRLAHLFARAEAQTALNAQRNAVSITLSASVPKQERTALEHESSNADVVMNVAPGLLGVTAQGMSTECGGFTKNGADCNKTLTSGVTIQPTGGGLCTAGPMAVPKTTKSATYLLTAGHCLKPAGIGAKWYAFNKAGSPQEIGPAIEFFDETKADAGAILINNNSYWINTTKDPIFADTAEWTKEASLSHFVEGERLPASGLVNCHEGQTTGQSCGVIGNVNATVIFSGQLVTGLVEDVGAISDEGDSGGPWMFIQTKSLYPVLMEGIYVGSAGTKLYYDPLRTVFKALTKLNLELLTTANETRS